MPSSALIPYRRVLLWYSLLFGAFLLGANLFIYQQHKTALQQEFRHSNQNVLNLLAVLGREAMLGENFALIEWFLNTWGQGHEHVAFLEMIGEGGFRIADFRKSNVSGPVIVLERQVDLTRHRLFTLRMGVSEQPIRQQLQQLMLQLFLVSILAVLVLGISVWLLLQRVAIRPLEGEIQRRTHAEGELKQQRQFLQTVIDSVSDRIMVIDNDYQVILMNAAARQARVPRCVAEPAPPKCHEILHQRDLPCSGEQYPCPLNRVRETGRPVSVVHNHPDSNGEIRYYELAASPLWGPDGKLQGIIEATRDLTTHLRLRDELEEKKVYLEYVAHHDALTGLPNRLLLAEHLERGIRQAHRERLQLALLFIDLDNFKQINDTFGHEAGDQVLKEVAKRLLGAVRETDTVARLGGDEFNVALLGLQNEDACAAVASNLVREIQDPYMVFGEEFVLTCSIGISLYPQDAETPAELMRNADTAMFRAKESGRNHFQFYTEEMTVRMVERVMLEKQLRQAVAEEQFVLHYQPQFGLGDQRIIGLEALLRWRHPTRGMLLPDCFLALAESTGLILPIGEWVLRTVCEQLNAWYAEGLNPGRVAVNLSGRQLQQRNLFEAVREVLERTGCRPEWLELEITEGCLMDRTEGCSRTLRKIQGLGVRTAIDDFGTGYSSLAYLKQLPIDKLKIDRSFIRDTPGDADDVAIVRAIIALGRTLGLKLIAEGVETETQRAFIAAEGCDAAQGFLFGRPLPGDEARRLLLEAREAGGD